MVRRVPNGWMVVQDGRPITVVADEFFTADGQPTRESFGKAMAALLGLQHGEALLDGDCFALTPLPNAYEKKS